MENKRSFWSDDQVDRWNPPKNNIPTKLMEITALQKKQQILPVKL